MDENIRIYRASNELFQPTTLAKPEDVNGTGNSKWKSWFDGEILKDVLHEQAEKEKKLAQKYPWVEILRNWILAGFCVSVAVALVIWGLNIRTERRAAVLTATAMADYQAEQEAQEAARQAELAAIEASEAKQIEREATQIAKAFFGIRNFEEKYGYSELDFETYARCMFNRVDNSGGVNDLESVINRKDQWVGYSTSNTVVDKYYKMAYKFVQAWHQEETKPCSTEFVYAELTNRGVFLKKDFEADAYSQRWRASN